MKASVSNLPIAIACGLLLLLTGCGTTSEVATEAGRTLKTPTRQFHHVTVQDFSARVKTSDGKSELATRGFPDKIANALRGSGFRTVTRNGQPTPDTLVIGGEITRYAEGNAALRFLVGMGAGSSYFDATTYFKDDTGATLGKIVTDKNSWGLGGGIAATQTPETFMNGAAQKIAEEARKFSGVAAAAEPRTAAPAGLTD